MPVMKQEFSEREQWTRARCQQWNGFRNLAQIAHELMRDGPEVCTTEWDLVGREFVRYFSKPHAFGGDPAKRDWEIISEIVQEFQSLVERANDKEESVA